MSLPELLYKAAQAARRELLDDRRLHAIGCLAERSDGILVRARNGSSKLPEPACHAEARCLRKVDKGATMYVARVRKDGSLGLAKPCASCYLRMRAKGVARCIYSIDNESYGTIQF